MMDENAHLHEIFKHINAILWMQAQKPARELPRLNGCLIEARRMAVAATGERTGNNIAAYIEQQTAMMLKLMAEERFLRFPLPTGDYTTAPGENATERRDRNDQD